MFVLSYEDRGERIVDSLGVVLGAGDDEVSGDGGNSANSDASECLEDLTEASDNSHSNGVLHVQTKCARSRRAEVLAVHHCLRRRASIG